MHDMKINLGTQSVYDDTAKTTNNGYPVKITKSDTMEEVYKCVCNLKDGVSIKKENMGQELKAKREALDLCSSQYTSCCDVYNKVCNIKALMEKCMCSQSSGEDADELILDDKTLGELNTILSEMDDQL